MPGPVGPQPLAGTGTGTSGFSGASGFSGYSGTSGFSGYSGASGFSGYSGVSGFSGYSGKSGFSGYSGAAGGSTTQVLYNNAGAIAGITGATSNGTSMTFGTGNLIGSGATVLTATDWILQTDSTFGVLMRNLAASAQVPASASKFFALDCGTNVNFSANHTAAGALETVSGGYLSFSSSSTQSNTAQDTYLRRNGAGAVGIGTASNNNSGTLIAASATLTTLASDATHTDNTVCADTTSGLLYKGSGTIGICLGTSSARFKEGITELQEGLKAILDLAPCAYFYKPGYGNDGAKRLYGFIAEQVVDVLPELVGPDGEGKPNSVDMVGLIPVLVNAIKDLAAQNQMLSERLNMLHAG